MISLDGCVCLSVDFWMSPGCRYREMEERGGGRDERTSDCDGSQRLAADVDTSGSACTLGSLILFIVSLVRLEEPLRSDTVHPTPHLSSHFKSLSICLSQHNANDCSGQGVQINTKRVPGSRSPGRVAVYFSVIRHKWPLWRSTWDLCS